MSHYHPCDDERCEPFGVHVDPDAASAWQAAVRVVESSTAESTNPTSRRGLDAYRRGLLAGLRIAAKRAGVPVPEPGRADCVACQAQRFHKKHQTAEELAGELAPLKEALKTAGPTAIATDEAVSERAGMITPGSAVDLIEHAARIILAKMREPHTAPYHWAGALWEAGMLVGPGTAVPVPSEPPTATCAHCGGPQRGSAAVGDNPLCHPNEGLDCYREVTVYGHPMPCATCVPCAQAVRQAAAAGGIAALADHPHADPDDGRTERQQDGADVTVARVRRPDYARAVEEAHMEHREETP